MPVVTNEFLAVLLGKTTDEIAASLTAVEEGKELTIVETETILRPLFVERNTREFNGGINKEKAKSKENIAKAQKELLGKFAEKFGVEPLDDVEAMLENAVVKSKASTKGEGIKETDVTSHGLYQQLKAQAAKEVADAKAAFETYKGESTYRETLQQVKEKSMAILASKNFDLPADAAIQKNLIDAMLGQLTNGIKAQVINNEIVLCDAEGNVLKNDLGNPVSFENHVENTAKGFFQVKQGDHRNSPGNAAPPQGAAVSHAGYNFTKPKDAEEGFNTWSKITDPKAAAAYKEILNNEFSNKKE